MFSKACEYAIRAVVYIQLQSSLGRKCNSVEIAGHTGAPVHFMAKVLQQLSATGVVSSQKGPVGGFYMDEAQKSQPLVNVVSAIDGDKIFSGCGLGLPYCSETNPCAIHHRFAHVRNSLRDMLNETKICDLGHTLKEGAVVLKRE